MSETTDSHSDWLPIGKIVSPQCLYGELRVYPESQFPERFLEPGERWLLRPQASVPEPVQLLHGRLAPKGTVYIVQLDGIETRTQAEALRNGQLLVPSDDRPPLEEGEFHYLDLMGLTVVEQASQTPLGIVTDLINSGNDLLQVTLFPDPTLGATANPDKKARQVLIPFVEAIVPVVDLDNRRLEITPPPGLLDL